MINTLRTTPETGTAHRFLCDEMLQRLGKWLRAAGYDTVIAAQGESDYTLLRQAIDEDRLLITRDKKLMEHRRAAGTVVYLDCASLDACAERLSEKVDIDWQLKPFTRCMSCNASLRYARPQQLSELPLAKKDFVDAAYYCPECKQLFWEGSHVKHMQEHLVEWQKRFSPSR